MNKLPHEVLVDRLVAARERVCAHLGLHRYSSTGPCVHVSSGKSYTYLGVSLVEASLEVVVIYGGYELTFTRPLDEFLRKFGPS